MAGLLIWLLMWRFSTFSVNSISPLPFFLDTLLLFMVLGVVLIIVIIFMQRSWAKEKYFIRGSLLIVSQKNPLTNAGTEDVYRLDTVVTASVKQSALGKRDNFGDIILSIPKLDGNASLILKDVSAPKTESLKLHKSFDNTDGSGFAITN